MATAGFDRFLGELECPVCLLIPREGPVGACSVGHLVCKTCRKNVETCPTCRRPMPKDGTNTIVNKMIEEIAHSCKYSKFGCEVKARLVELVDHESRCPERTIKCPYLKCNEEVQIKKYRDHASCSFGNSGTKPAYTSFHLYNGQSIESKLSKNHYWHMKAIKSKTRDVQLRLLKVDVTEEEVKTCVDCQRYFVSDDSFQKHFQEVHRKEDFPSPTIDVYATSSSSSSSPRISLQSKNKRGEIFYLHQYFFSKEQSFAFYVTGDAEKSLVKITLKNSNDPRKFHATVQNVISMDSAPRNSDEVLASKDVMFVPWRQMSGFLKWIEKDEEKYSAIQTTVDIIDE